MPKYIFTYRRSHAVDAPPDRVEASSDCAPAAEAMAAWTAFLDAVQIMPAAWREPYGYRMTRKGSDAQVPS
jgi:hypothetical protein